MSLVQWRNKTWRDGATRRRHRHIYAPSSIHTVWRSIVSTPTTLSVFRTAPGVVGQQSRRGIQEVAIFRQRIWWVLDILICFQSPQNGGFSAPRKASHSLEENFPTRINFFISQNSGEGQLHRPPPRRRWSCTMSNSLEFSITITSSSMHWDWESNQSFLHTDR